MTTNVVSAVLNETDRYFETEPLFAYNYGNVLEFTGVELPAYFEVHFAKKENDDALTVLGENNLVSIPDELLLEGDQLFAWVYLHTGADDGETMCVIRIPVLRRARITGAEPTPVQQDIIEQAIAALENGVEEVQELAASIPGTINSALQEAKDSGEFDGEPGVSPVVSVDEISGGHRVTIIDAEGNHPFNVMDGRDGGAAELIDDQAGAGDLSKTWSANKMTDELSAKADKTDTVLDTTLSRGRKDGTGFGTNSIAFGYNVEASASNSQAFGSSTVASGSSSHAEGYGGYYYNSWDSGSITPGAYGPGDHSEGYQTYAESNTSGEGGAHAEGYRTQARSSGAHAEGRYTKATYPGAHSEGQETKATQISAHAEGTGTEASGYGAHAEGASATASGHAAHAEGCATIAAGRGSHVAGMYNVADSFSNWPEWKANTSYRVGDKVKITQSFPGTYGYICLIANSDSTFTSYKWQAVYDRMNYAEIIGNGTVDERSNARALDWDGNEYLKGDVYVKCNKNSGSGVKLATINQLPSFATNAETEAIITGWEASA